MFCALAALIINYILNYSLPNIVYGVYKMLIVFVQPTEVEGDYGIQLRPSVH